MLLFGVVLTKILLIFPLRLVERHQMICFFSQLLHLLQCGS